MARLMQYVTFYLDEKLYGFDIRFGDKPVGFLADMIGDVVTVSTDNIENPTQKIEKADSQFISGIVKLKETLLIILDPNKLFFLDMERSE